MSGFTTLKNWMVPQTKEERLEKFQVELRKGNEELRMKKSAQKLLEEAKKSSKREDDRKRQRQCRQRKALLEEMVDPGSGKALHVSRLKKDCNHLAGSDHPDLRSPRAGTLSSRSLDAKQRQQKRRWIQPIPLLGSPGEMRMRTGMGPRKEGRPETDPSEQMRFGDVATE